MSTSLASFFQTTLSLPQNSSLKLDHARCVRTRTGPWTPLCVSSTTTRNTSTRCRWETTAPSTTITPPRSPRSVRMSSHFGVTTTSTAAKSPPRAPRRGLPFVSEADDTAVPVVAVGINDACDEPRTDSSSASSATENSNASTTLTKQPQAPFSFSSQTQIQCPWKTTLTMTAQSSQQPSIKSHHHVSPPALIPLVAACRL